MQLVDINIYIHIYIYYLKHLKHGRFAIFFYHQDYFTWLSYSDLRNVHDCSSCTSKLPNTSLEAIEQLYYPVISGLVDKPLYGSLSFPTRIQWKVRNFFFSWRKLISENQWKSSFYIGNLEPRSRRIFWYEATLWWSSKLSITTYSTSSGPSASVRSHIAGGFIFFITTWGNDPIWLIFFKEVETTN